MLNLKNIVKIFPGSFKPILNNLDLHLSKGEFCILIGSNGSGKSTLMKSISSEYAINSGEIILDKRAIIANVTQDINKGTIPEMSLLENMVLSGLLGKNASFSFYKNKASQAIEIAKELGIGLEIYIDRPLKHLSGGQRQMIATLMAISSNPDLLLLDEHTSALDPKMQNLLMEYTAKAIEKNKITTLMITHKLDDAIRYGDRLIMLHQGKVVFDVRGKEKQNLKIDQLLALFHSYEDSILRNAS